MTPEQALAELRRIRYAPTIASLSRDSGVSRTAIYRTIRTGRISDKHKRALERVLQSEPKQRDHNRRSASIYEPARGILRDLQR